MFLYQIGNAWFIFLNSIAKYGPFPTYQTALRYMKDLDHD